MTDTIFERKVVEVRFLCDSKIKECGADNPFCGSGYCQNTPLLSHAINGSLYLYDPAKFLSERCVVQDRGDKLIFWEHPIKEMTNDKKEG